MSRRFAATISDDCDAPGSACESRATPIRREWQGVLGGFDSQNQIDLRTTRKPRPVNAVLAMSPHDALKCPFRISKRDQLAQPSTRFQIFVVANRR
jgi:hypothetical protein